MANGASIEDYFQSAGGQASKRRRLDADDTGNRDQHAPRDTQNGDSSWQQRHDYSCQYLGELKPGPQRVTFTARIVNIYDVPNNYSSPTSGNARGKGSKGRHGFGSTSARGHLKILVKDDSGLIHVPCHSLFYGFSNTDVTIWIDYPVVCREALRWLAPWDPDLGLDDTYFRPQASLEEDTKEYKGCSTVPGTDYDNEHIPRT